MVHIISPPPARAPFVVGFVGTIGRACFGDLLLRVGGIEPAFRSATRRALLSAVHARTVSLAVLPGAPEPGFRTLHLCDDRIVVAMVADAAFDPCTLGGVPLLLSGDSGAADMRRIVARVPGIGGCPLNELPMPDLIGRVATGSAVALVCEGEADELPAGIVTRRIPAPQAAFAIHLHWRGADAAGREIAALAAALRNVPDCGDETATKR